VKAAKGSWENKGGFSHITVQKRDLPEQILLKNEGKGGRGEKEIAQVGQRKIMVNAGRTSPLKN